jgi:hypothetical protein
MVQYQLAVSVWRSGECCPAFGAKMTFYLANTALEPLKKLRVDGKIGSKFKVQGSRAKTLKREA